MASANKSLMSRRKLALIIGNNNYSRPESKLRHCLNDANDLSVVLEDISFNVTTKFDLTNAQMVSTINDFKKRIIDGDLVLFYFSGHGYQVKDRNYLMPIDDGQIETEDDVEDFAVHVERTIERLAKKTPSYVTICILDCCRKYWPKKTPKTKGRSEIESESLSILHCLATIQGKGLHTMTSPAGTFIQFACDADQTASDGLAEDRNGLFTRHLLKHIANPNEDIVQIFQGIAADVYEESDRKQRPLSINALYRRGRVYLNEFIVHTLPGNEVEERSFIDSRQGTRLHDACRNLGDIDTKDKPFVLKLNSNDNFVIGKDSKDSQTDLKLIKTLDRVIAQNESHPFTDELIERLAKAHNTDKKNIVLKNVYLS